MSSQAEHFFQLIDKGCSQLSQLCSLLDQERDAIEQRTLEQLKDVVNEKARVLEQIAENINGRNDVLKQAGFSADDSGLSGYLESLPPAHAKAIDERWQLLAAQLKTTNELNQRNEKIIKRSQQSISQLLSIMQGHSQKTTLYNQSGSKGNYSPQNTLGKA